MSGSNDYLHGYDPKEQSRLYDQARYLEPRVLEGFDFSAHGHVLEVGCGVGAQTEILLRRFPNLRVTGIDISSAQIERARSHLESLPELRHRSDFLVGDASDLQPSTDRTYDGAYLCWILEHVKNPLALLGNLKRILKPGSKICVAEVFNSTLFVHPRKPALMRYWEAYNVLQSSLGGDPWVGGKLGALLASAGFSEVRIRPHPILEDCRDPEGRESILVYWRDLLLSASDQLLERGLVDQALIEQLEDALRSLRKDPGSIFFYAFMKAEGLT